MVRNVDAPGRQHSGRIVGAFPDQLRRTIEQLPEQRAMTDAAYLNLHLIHAVGWTDSLHRERRRARRVRRALAAEPRPVQQCGDAAAPGKLAHQLAPQRRGERLILGGERSPQRRRHTTIQRPGQRCSIVNANIERRERRSGEIGYACRRLDGITHRHNFTRRHGPLQAQRNRFFPPLRADHAHGAPIRADAEPFRTGVVRLHGLAEPQSQK